jgi:hypothetical protein
MGSLQPSGLNWDSDGKFTLGEYANRGDAVDKWIIWVRSANGGFVAVGATTDAASITGDGSVIALLKGIRAIAKREDDAHATNDYGFPAWMVRNDGLAARGADNDYGPAAVGQGGELFATPCPPLNATSAVAVALTEAASTVLEASRIIKASAGTLFRLGFYNSNAAARFVLLHNSATLPADAVAPMHFWPVDPGKRIDLDFGRYGIRCSAGITVCLSTTGPTKTIGAAEAWFNAGYK